jgi:hypothetical protein
MSTNHFHVPGKKITFDSMTIFSMSRNISMGKIQKEERWWQNPYFIDIEA